MTTNTRKAAIERERIAHHRALETLRSPDCELSGLQLWRKLRRLEQLAHACTEAYCNGERIQIRWPIGPKDRELNLREFDFRDSDCWDQCCECVRDCVRQIFGQIPDGFYVNGDARGSALKLDPDKVTIPQGMHRDLGGNGILAAEIS